MSVNICTPTTTNTLLLITSNRTSEPQPISPTHLRLQSASRMVVLSAHAHNLHCIYIHTHWQVPHFSQFTSSARCIRMPGSVSVPHFNSIILGQRLWQSICFNWPLGHFVFNSTLLFSHFHSVLLPPLFYFTSAFVSNWEK